MKVETAIKIDLAHYSYTPEVEAVQGDRCSRTVCIQLMNNGKPWHPPVGTEAAVAYSQNGGTKGFYNKLPDGTPAVRVQGSTVSAVLASPMLAVPGTVKAAIVFNNGQLDQLTSFPFRVNVKDNPFLEAQEPEDYIRLQWLEDKLDEYLRKAKDSGMFDGQKGEAFTYEDFTPEQLEALTGPAGDNTAALAAAQTANSAAAAANQAAAAAQAVVDSAAPDIAQLKEDNININGLFYLGSQTTLLPSRNVYGKTVTVDFTKVFLENGFVSASGIVNPNSKTNRHFSLPLYGIKSVSITCTGSTATGLYYIFTDVDGASRKTYAPVTGSSKQTIHFDMGTTGTIWFNCFGGESYAHEADITYYTEKELKNYLTVDDIGSRVAIPIPKNGYIDVSSGKIVSDSTGNWVNTGFIETLGFQKIYLDNIYHHPNAAMLAFYDKDLVLVKAETEGATKTGISGEYTIPADAVWFCACNSMRDCPDCRISALREMTGYTQYSNQRKMISVTDHGAYNRINVIGDSISEGSCCTTDYLDSWAGILRGLISIENGGRVNYGFASYPDPTELKITNTMVNPLGNNWSRKWNGTSCYGNNEFTASEAGKVIKISISRKFPKMRIAYMAGSDYGVFKVERRPNGETTDTLLATIDCSNSETTAKMSDYIDISTVEIGDQLRITLVSGTCTVSGFELVDNPEWTTFNNYGRAAAQPVFCKEELLALESDCDLLFYALGVNGSKENNRSDYDEIAPYLRDKKIQKVVIDFCLKSSLKNGIDKAADIRDFAANIGAKLIRPYDAMPKDDSGNVLSAYLSEDGIHPNDNGHKFIAEYIAKQIGLSVTSKEFGAMLQQT